MATNYFGNPYKFGNAEYNPNGDSYNGQIGTKSPGATVNQNSQPTTKGNPFESMLQHALALSSYRQGQTPQPQPGFQQPGLNPGTGNYWFGRAADDPGRFEPTPPTTPYPRQDEPVPYDPEVPYPNRAQTPAAGGGRNRAVNPGTPAGGTPSVPQLPTDMTDPRNAPAPMQGGGGVDANGWPLNPESIGYIPYLTGPGPGADTSLPPASGSGSGGSSSGGGSVTSTTTPGSATNPTPRDVAALIHDRFAKQFGYEREDLARAMNAQAALTGDINSGGYGDVFGRQMGRLVGQQGGREAEFIQQANENALNRELQKYGIDKDAFVRELSAKLGLEGTKYGANASVQAAREHAAAQQAAASIAASAQRYGADASRYETDMRYKLGLGNLDVDRENNLLRYVLGMYGLGNDALRNLFPYTPGGVFGSGGQVPGGTTVIRP